MPYRDPDIDIRPCNQGTMESVAEYIRRFELDDRAMYAEEFLTAYVQDQLVGFGRIRKHETCYELCSLGVIVPERRKGIGRKLTLHLALKARDPLYLVCIIPEFFEPLGFTICHNFPQAMQEKLDYCTSSLPVPETYVVMKKQG